MILLDRIKSLARLFLFTPLCELVDIIVMSLFRSAEKNKKGRKRLLVIRLDAIGDFFLFLDTFKEYKKLYPEAIWKVTLLGNQAWAELAEYLPHGFRCWFLDRKRFLSNPFYRYKILKQVREEGFNTVIQPTFSREYTFGDAVVRASGATERIGSAGGLNNMITWQKKRSDRWYTHLIPASDKPLIELERNAEFLRGLGLKEFRASTPVFHVKKIPQLPKKVSNVSDLPFFVISPGSAVAGRRWPADRFATVAKSLYKTTGFIPVICGGSGEEVLAKNVISFIPTLPWKNLAGKTSLGQLLRILDKAEILISNETSTVHLAASVGCPTVCIMGGGHFGRFFPYGDLDKNSIVYKHMDCYGCNWWCKYLKAQCILEVTVDDVKQKICHILKMDAL